MEALQENGLKEEVRHSLAEAISLQFIPKRY
jgi:hypothetical protein